MKQRHYLIVAKLIVIHLLLLTAFSPAYAKNINDAKQLIRAKDFSGAHSIYKDLAKKGNIEAQYSLAVLYRNGHGTNKNLEQAYKWFMSAARNNHQKAQYELGMLYKSGQGTTRSIAKAHYWLNKSAKQGNIKAAQQLEIIAFVSPDSKQSDNEIFNQAMHAIEKNNTTTRE